MSKTRQRRMRSARASGSRPLQAPARWRLAVAVIALAAAGCTREAPPGSGSAPTPPIVAQPPPPPPSAFTRMVFPTEQTALLSAPPESAFQPTAAGRIESAFFGPVRTAGSGYAQFHEGIDIAATRRDRSGRALDQVFAAAPGTVGYINRASGNSNYGIYVVLLHEDPVGSAYTLYAHLSQVKPGLQAGSAVQAGDELGIMGNTPSTSIPVVRSHTHFEVGLVNNSRFRAWFLGQKLKPDHGMFNGWNLLAIDALKVLERQQALGSAFTLRDHLATLPRAFRIVVQARRPPDFFRRYPSLWTGETGEAPAVVLECTDNGLPLAGRPATPEEAQALGRRPAAVLGVDEAVLGRNGCRFVVKRNGNWEMGKASERWLSILLY